MSLKFNIKGLTNEILNKLEIELSNAFETWKQEVLSKVRHNYFGGGINPQVEYQLKRETNIIIAYLKANSYVLADSYGTGSFMLTNSPRF